MDAWVYVLSKFTQEAMLFEALVLFLGFAAYGAYFVTRRRKYGVAQSEVPSNLVKVYLAQLVADAEDLRIQLFGLLGRGSVDASFLQNLGQSAPTAHSHAPAPTSTTTTTVVSNDPLLQSRLREVEAKLGEQARALENVLNEKTRLEQELALARTQSPAAAAPASGDGASDERIRQLEAQLAEYAIIEDDLANLKRLQRENKQLREQLAKGDTTSPPVAAPIRPEAATPAAAAPAPDAPVAAPAAPVAAAPAAPTPTLAAAETSSAAAAAPAEAAQPDFESLVDQVEKSLDGSGKAADAVAAATDDTTPPKTEKELQDEFEKMLNA